MSQIRIQVAGIDRLRGDVTLSMVRMFDGKDFATVVLRPGDTLEFDPGPDGVRVQKMGPWSALSDVKRGHSVVVCDDQG